MTVTSPRGFSAAGVAAGIKESGGADVAVVINNGPSCAAAGVFTSNRVKAAPVLWSQQVLLGGRLRGVVLNSGGANACTGPAGFADTHQTAEHLAAVMSADRTPRSGAGVAGAGEAGASGVGVSETSSASVAAGAGVGGAGTGGAGVPDDVVGPELSLQRQQGASDVAHRAGAPFLGASAVGAGEIAVCSTGLIGERLPLDRLLAGVTEAVAAASADGGPAAADAIRTTDTVPKTCSVAGPGYVIGGMAKGAAMLAPALATMLVVLTTDADLEADELDAALRGAVAETFDRLDTDGCMSTNDTVLLLASGAAQTQPELAEFTALLTGACADLARQMQQDAEGASKAIAIEVTGAANVADAVTVGRAIARCNLLKCALHGEDPNWGRVLAAIGTTDAVFEPDELDVAMNGVWVCRRGAAAEDRAAVDLKPRDIRITVNLSAGPHAATILTTDLTAEYVYENSAYAT
jgi:glutamate N-acetyltransferase/amino-acid N-acetyltransferase